MATENRLSKLQHHERERGLYTKRKSEYWSEGIHKLRSEKRAKSSESNSPDDDNTTQQDKSSDDCHEFHNMKVSELWKLIKEKGIKQKGMSKLKKEQLVLLLKHNSA